MSKIVSNGLKLSFAIVSSNLILAAIVKTQSAIAHQVVDPTAAVINSSLNSQHQPHVNALIAQSIQAQVVQVTGIKLNPTANGVNLILETSGDLSSQVSTSSYENTITAEISNSQLNLPQGKFFHQNNLSTEITALTINQTVNNKIQVIVTGKSAVPMLGVINRDRTLTFSLNTPKNTTLTQSNSTPRRSNPEIDDPTIQEIIVTSQKRQTSTPVYTISQTEIQKQGSNSLAEALKGLPGFAINDAGFGADIHTGTYYRGHSINQSVFLMNGRPIGSNINTYHGATDLNSIPVESIERVELSSGTSSTLYGSEAFGGVVNIITKQNQISPRVNGVAEYGSFNQSNYRLSYGSKIGAANFNLGYEKLSADNRYPVPAGAANRDSNGLLFNGDIATSNYYGNLTFPLNSRNTINLNAYTISSRRGLLYFGFPLQRDRLDHDTLNVGLSSETLLGNNDDSVLKTILSYNQDYFNTYGPTQNIYYRTGTLNSQAIAARIEHQWQLAKPYNLTWGLDLKNSYLTGEVSSTAPNRIDLNETENKNRLQSAIFALNTWKPNDSIQVELGLRQNIDSEFGTYLNPTFGTKLAITSNLAIRGSWASEQRNPGLDQLYVYDTVHNWLPNPDLKPETGSSWTAGLDVNFSRNLTGQFTYFGSSLNERLGVQTGKWANIGLVNTNGLEAALRYRITPAWSTFINYTYTDAKIETGAEKGLQLGLIPFSVAQLGIGYERQGWQLNLFGSYYSGSRRAIFNNPSEQTTDFSPAYLNLDLTSRIPLTKNLGLTLYLENLADAAYEKANRIYQPGLTFRVGLQSNI
ncbi:TonB-dependent receptor plug [Crinalium epipsammum PCC 9333]|uniref:TonB-dependent receptor plug n=1 Tax=Crinalium epipsammum PCC 9333 TaxID=1173022 RepID=K9VWT3_9CYAN|nr:TonB-dependent receptor [Crinalium epipsammum]AFZ12451.1 TonB-dependent receptor plug [Crinalium epipsammum PCC 9333]